MITVYAKIIQIAKWRKWYRKLSLYYTIIKRIETYRQMMAMIIMIITKLLAKFEYNNTHSG